MGPCCAAHRDVGCWVVGTPCIAAIIPEAQGGWVTCVRSPASLHLPSCSGYQLIDPELCRPQVRAYVESQIDLVAKVGLLVGLLSFNLKR